MNTESTQTGDACESACAADNRSSPSFPLRFNALIPFLMHGIVSNAVAHATEEFAQMGLNVAEARVLAGVLQNPGIRVGPLSELTCIAQSTLSHLLRRICRQGLAERQRDHHDNRSVIVRLTPLGREKAGRCVRLAELQDQIIVAGIAPQRIEELRALLAEIYHRFVANPNSQQALVANINPAHRPGPRTRRS
jgi:MarR family transcriptional regulator, organic hydroperoxide resistance regulator